MMTFIIIATLMVVTAVAVTVCVMRIRQMVLINQKLKIKEAIAREDARSNRDIQRRLEISFAHRVEACGGNPDAIHELLMLANEMSYIFRYAIPVHHEFLANCKLKQADLERDREKFWYVGPKTLSRRGFPVE